MIWWFRTRRGTAAITALVLVMTLGAAAPEATVPVPLVLGGMSFPLPLPLVLPLVPVVALLLGQQDNGQEHTAVRAVPRWDLTAMCVLVAAAALTGLCQWWWGGWSMGPAMARDFAGYLGLALLLRWLAGPAIAVAGSTVFPFFCASFGIVAGGHPRWWAWPFHEPASAIASASALALLLAGLAATLGTERPRTPWRRTGRWRAAAPSHLA